MPLGAITTHPNNQFMLKQPGAQNAVVLGAATAGVTLLLGLCAATLVALDQPDDGGWGVAFWVGLILCGPVALLAGALAGYLMFQRSRNLRKYAGPLVAGAVVGILVVFLAVLAAGLINSL